MNEKVNTDPIHDFATELRTLVFKSNEYFELITSNNNIELKKVLVWQFYEYKTQ